MNTGMGSRDERYLWRENTAHPLAPRSRARAGLQAAWLLGAGIGPRRRRAWPAHRSASRSDSSSCSLRGRQERALSRTHPVPLANSPAAQIAAAIGEGPGIRLILAAPDVISTPETNCQR